MISERLKAAFAVAKTKGMKFGLAKFSKAKRREVITLGLASRRKAEMERAEAYRLHIEWAFRQPSVHGHGRPISFHAAANKLNDRNIESPCGGRWSIQTIMRMGKLLGIYHPPGKVTRAAVRARVREVYAVSPEITGQELKACAALDHPVGVDRIRKYLKEARLETARKCPIYRLRNWQIDSRTDARVRIWASLKRNPGCTPAQVVVLLGPKWALKLRWVNLAMQECRSGADRKRNTRLNWPRSGRTPFWKDSTRRGSIASALAEQQKRANNGRIRYAE